MYLDPMTFTSASGSFTVCTYLSEGQISYADGMSFADAAFYADKYNAIDDQFFYGVQFVGKDEAESIIQQGESLGIEEVEGWTFDEYEARVMDEARRKHAFCCGAYEPWAWGED